MDWRIKAVVQAVLAVVPGGGRVNEFLQRAMGGRKLSNVSDAVTSKLREFARMQTALDKVGFSPYGKNVLEIGTGWEPIFAVYLSLLGARVITLDVVRHLKTTSYVRLALATLIERVSTRVCLNPGYRDTLDSFLRSEIDCDGLLQGLNITYIAPVQDSYIFKIPAGSSDLVFSIAVLEHARPSDIETILLGSKHVLRPDGLAYHDIGLGDHFRSTDSPTTFSSFLQYDGRLWEYLGENRLNYHNRLRRSDFRHLFCTHGAKIVWSESLLDQQAMLLLNQGKLKVARRFARYEVDDLATWRYRVLMAYQSS